MHNTYKCVGCLSTTSKNGKPYSIGCFTREDPNFNGLDVCRGFTQEKLIVGRLYTVVTDFGKVIDVIPQN